MMPTFPSPPLKFRKAGFPRYGFKAGLSDKACPVYWFAIVLRALCFHRAFPALCQGRCAYEHFRASGLPLYPRGPSLRTGLCCPGPSSLNRPHPPHSREHPDFADSRLIRDALAVRFRLGDLRVVPCFHCTFLLHMPPSMTAGSSSAALLHLLSSFTDDFGLRPESNGSALPKFPSSVSDGGMVSRLPWFAALAAACRVACPLTDLTGHFAQATGTFTPELPANRSTFSSSGIATWQLSASTDGTFTHWNVS